MVKEEDSNMAVIRLGGGLVYGGDLTVVSLASLRCYILYTSYIYNIQRMGENDGASFESRKLNYTSASAEKKKIKMS